MVTYKERDEEKRKEFLKTIEMIPQDQVVYVDEAGIDQFMYRPYARALRGEKVFGQISGRKYPASALSLGNMARKSSRPSHITEPVIMCCLSTGSSITYSKNFPQGKQSLWTMRLFTAKPCCGGWQKRRNAPFCFYRPIRLI